jgi:hypothetical protein
VATKVSIARRQTMDERAEFREAAKDIMAKPPSPCTGQAENPPPQVLAQIYRLEQVMEELENDAAVLDEALAPVTREEDQVVNRPRHAEDMVPVAAKIRGVRWRLEEVLDRIQGMRARLEI